MDKLLNMNKWKHINNISDKVDTNRFIKKVGKKERKKLEKIFTD